MSYTPPPPPPGGPGGYAYPAPRTSGKAVASLVSGIVGLPLFLCCTLSGVPAVVLGFMARSEIRKSQGTLTGDGMATAGLILGLIAVVLGVAGIILVFATGAFSEFYDSSYP